MIVTESCEEDERAPNFVFQILEETTDHGGKMNDVSGTNASEELSRGLQVTEAREVMRC